MSNKLTATLAIAAGFIGGFASHYFVTPPVYAQAPAVPQEIRAHKFVLVDETGVARGVFGIEANGVPEIEVSTPKGQGYRIWGYQATDWGHMHGTLTGPQVKGPEKPTLMAAKP
jgi:hypothetical protein